MHREFDHFTSFFHQDAFFDGNDIETVANSAINTMSAPEIESLVEFLRDLVKNRDNDYIIKTWNESRSDFYVKHGDVRKFIDSLLCIAQSRL